MNFVVEKSEWCVIDRDQYITRNEMEDFEDEARLLFGDVFCFQKKFNRQDRRLEDFMETEKHTVMDLLTRYVQYFPTK